MDHLITESRNPDSETLDQLSSPELVELMNREDAQVIPAVAAESSKIARAIDLIADRLRSGGRLIYMGAGTSGRLGVLDATECPPTFNSPPGQVVGLIAGGPPALTRAVEGAEDHPEYGENDLKNIQLTSRDVVVGIATSGRTPYVLGGVAYARSLGCVTIGLSCNPESELSAVVDLAIHPLVGPEILTGSTRLKAGTATKMILNMFTTGAMVRLGKTYGNLMIDLRATNEKLQARTNRILRWFTGINTEEAEAILKRCAGELKTAIVSRQLEIPADEARQRLIQAGGQVRVALERSGSPNLSGDPQNSVEHFSFESSDRPPQPPLGKGGIGGVDHDTNLETPLVLGIDGGGTKTVALLASSDGQVLGQGEAGGSNLQTVGFREATRAIEDAISRAFIAANIPRAPVGSASLGLAGAGREDDQRLIREWASQVHFADAVEVVGDMELLFTAGTPFGWGLVVVAGTGSIAMGRSADGRQARAGGWGPLLSDEGSAYTLALEALRALVRAEDGRGEATEMTLLLLKKLGVSSVAELVGPLYRGEWDRARIASLAPIVLEMADSGDSVATALVRGQAEQLGNLAITIIDRVGFAGNVPLALAGGLLLRAESYRSLVLNRIKQHCPVSPVTLVEQPAQGAVERAIRRLRSNG